MEIIKQGVGRTVLTSQLLDSSGLPVTAAAAADFSYRKASGSPAPFSSGVAHSHNGYYLVTLTNAQVDTPPDIAVTTNNANYAMAKSVFEIKAPKAYDFEHGTGLPDVNLTEINGGSVLQDTASGGGGTDPLLSPVPGSYGAGTAGYVLGNGVKLAANALAQIVVEAGVDPRQALSLILAAVDGIVTGAGTGTVTFKDATGQHTRIVAGTDGAGNRTSITNTPS